MRERLKAIHGINITYAAVCKQLLKLKAQGLLKTFPRRFSRNVDGTVHAIPPNRSLTVKALRWLMKTSVKVSKALWNHVIGKEKMPRVTAKRISLQRKSWYEFKDKSLNRVAALLPSIGESFA